MLTSQIKYYVPRSAVPSLGLTQNAEEKRRKTRFLLILDSRLFSVFEIDKTLFKRREADGR